MTEIPMPTLDYITGDCTCRFSGVTAKDYARHFYGVTAKDGTEYVYDHDKNILWQDIEGLGWSSVTVSDETLAMIEASIEKLKLKG